MEYLQTFLFLIKNQPLETALVLMAAALVLVVYLFSKNFKKAATNDFHEVPDVLKEIRDDIRSQNKVLIEHTILLSRINANTEK